MAATYIWPNIRALLITGFTEAELRQFCFDAPDFKPLYPHLAQQSSQADIAQQLLDYAERTAKTEVLLAWAAEKNPARFEEYQPYRSRRIEPGESLSQGRYYIVKLLGKGGMAEVYQANDTHLSRRVAIKFIQADDEDTVERFFDREAVSVAQLDHPHIVHIYDVKQEDDLYYLVMQFLDGRSLADKLEAHRPLTLAEIWPLFKPLTEAIAYAHSKGIIHRDLKPANIMFTADGKMVVTDFGIAHIQDVGGQTKTGAIMGTPLYMSPEQAQGEKTDPRSDIYSLGVILYELATGQTPFNGSPTTILLKHVTEPPPRPRSFNPDLPPVVEAVILKALQKRPADRYQTVAEMAEALLTALASAPDEGVTQPSPPPQSPPNAEPLPPKIPPLPSSTTPPSQPAPQFRYHVFISYSRADRDWVQSALLPYLEKAGLKVCIDFRDFAPAAPRPAEVERAILTSQKMLLVLTPDYLESEWAEFGNLMLQALDPASHERRLVTLLKAPCDLPPRLSFLVPIDLVDPPDEAIAWSQLIGTLGGQVVLPPPPSPWQALVRRGQRFLRKGGRTSLMALGVLGILTVLLLRPTSQPSPTATPIGPMDESGFNIAVAEFALLGEAATEPDLATAGQDVAKWLAEGIKEEKVVHLNIRAPVREPDLVGIIPGQDGETRKANAEQYAYDNNVNILIYGVITGSHNSYFVQPEFYVAGDGFDYASEIAGPNQLGQPEPIYLPFDKDDLEKNALNNKLMSRRRVLHHVIYGLAYLYYNTDDNKYYLEAFKEFEYAANEEQGKGLEVVHLLKGAAKMREYNSIPCKKNPALMEAQDAFTQAFQLNPNYARSYLGLGSVFMEQAKIFEKECIEIAGVHPDKLLEAKNWYSKSLEIEDQSELVGVSMKAIFSLGQINLLGFQKDPTGSWSKDEARRYFKQVAAEYQPGQRSDLIWVAGQTRANLCLLADLDKDWLTVFCECQRAIAILNTLPDKRFVDDQIATYQREVAFAQERLPTDISCP